MTRLPTIGSDNNNWGSILNSFLQVAHNADGSLNAVVSVKDSVYGAKGDGVTDDTTAIANALSAANAAGGGMVLFPPGVYITQTQQLFSNVHLRGAGIGATTIRLKSGTNADLFQGSVGLIGSTNNGGTTDWSMKDMIIDGNGSNQSGTSNAITCYGYDWCIRDVRIMNALTSGLRLDWHGASALPTTSTQMESVLDNVKVMYSGDIGINFTGPHDSHFINVWSILSAATGIYVGPNAVGMRCTQMHVWGKTTIANSPAILIEAPECDIINSSFEGSLTAQVIILNDRCTIMGGMIFSGNIGSPHNNVGGLVIGQTAGNTPYYGSSYQSGGVTTAISPKNAFVKTIINNCGWANGAVWMANDGGDNSIEAICAFANDTNPDVTTTGNVIGRSSFNLMATNITANGTTGKGGGVRIARSASNAFFIVNPNTANGNYFNVNTNSGKVETPNGVSFVQYSDNFATRTVQLSDGTISLLQSASAVVITNASTITISGVGIARVNPSANVTGIIMQTGTNIGQKCIVRNESSFTVTFDVSGTSNVADGATVAIPALCSREFEWSGSLWYRMA